MLNHKFCLIALCISGLISSTAVSQNVVDIYFIAGQSNAGNFGEVNSYDVQGYNGYNAADFDNQTESGFTLSFGRIRDRDNTRTDDSVNDFVESFTESRLDATNYAVDNFAVNVNQAFGNDMGIFSYGRNGRPLANRNDDNGQSWFPGTVASPFNDELYGSFLNWSAQRIADVEEGADGVLGTADDQIANVQGIIWFQGETDSATTEDAAAYQSNFENLVARFRNDFANPELAIVASEIRELNGGDATVNAALNTVAANDDNVLVIDIGDATTYTPVSANDVHLNANGLIALSNDFADGIVTLGAGTSAVPEPGSAGICLIGLLLAAMQRRKSA